MKPSIQLRLSQQLKMTPQLQQAIRLLQLSTLELKLEVHQALESNLMLELDEAEAEEGEPAANDANLASAETERPATEQPGNDINNEQEVQIETESMPDDLPVDTVWEDIYEPGSPAPAYPTNPDFDPLSLQGQHQTLQDHLNWQMEMAHFSAVDRQIAEAIIDDLNQNGYLDSPLSDILASLQAIPADLDDAETVLHRIQHFDPPGIAARDLRECLLIQATLLPIECDQREHAIELLQNHFDLLAARDEAQLRRRLGVSQEELHTILQLIRSLNPRPGSGIREEATAYIEPDVYVSRRNGCWQVKLNGNVAPALRVNSYYADLVKRADTSRDNTTLKNHLQEARWFIKSLHSRNQTILRVASVILDMQRDFFEHGDEAMKPLVLKDVADVLEMHESTVSRVTMQKYMHTPRGVYEFKHFFSSHVSTMDGGEASATAIRAVIKKLVQSEPAKKPLSDNKIATLLAERGFRVARRTVAKYRESMQIPPSNERKRLL